VPQGLILDPLLFLVYINHLPKAIEHKAIPILFANNTSILITSPNNIKFQSDVNIVFGQLNKWFKSICFPGSFTKLTSFNLLTKICVLQSDVNIVFGQLNKWFKSICFPGIFTKLTSFNLLTKICVLLTYKLHMKINRFIQLLK